ncbi:SCL-interrupting locus protein homolog isoform X3 [Strongylocentrotus purpuratus]|nr:SCL-interrupting locus protein homolog isoform X3 [Strongylocentrotus purpuratus]XP_030851960.1 SCL-interrupting locus protein homolog isoform X3 [Strongylocentrotus purpuratus]
MDETRKLLLLLESDPKTSTIPLIGIWMSGLTHMSNPVVWSACLRFLHSSGIQERVCSPNGKFLVVLFTRTSRQPLFYECMVKSEQDPRFMLVGCRENLHVFKHVSAKGKPRVEMELTPARSGPSKSLFMQSLSQLTSSQKHQRSSSRRRSSATEESQLVPRPSPKPMLDKSPSVLPSVPELSFISDSFCEPTDRRRNDQVTANVHPQHQPDHVVHRQRLSGQSEVTGINKKMSVNRRRLHGTSKTPPQGQHSTGMKGSELISKQNRPGPLRALNGQELETARRKGGHSGETQDTVKKTSQPKDKAGKIMTTQSSGYGRLHQRHTNRPGQGRLCAPHISQHRSTASSAGNKSSGRLHQQQRPQPMQQPKSSSQKIESDYQPSHEQPHQQESEIHSEGIGSVLPPHQPGTPTGHYHSTINSHLGNTDVHDHSNIPSHSSSTVQHSITHEGQCYAETSDHHQDDATTSGPSNSFPKTVASHGHSNLMTTMPQGHVPSPLHYQTQTAEGVTVQNAQRNVVGRLGAAIMGDQSRELSGLDTKTLEQLKRQEEMIQQLQEQIKLLLQAHIPQPPASASTPLGLITPPATPQGAQNLINEPKESPDVHKVHRLPDTGSFHSNPDTMQSPPAVVSSSKEHHIRDTSTPENVAALGVHQQATTAPSTRQSLQSPVMCSMAVNTGQSLFWSTPVDDGVSHVPGSPPMQSEPKIARRASTTSLGPAAMLAPDSNSTPVGTQQSSDVLHQTRKVVETADSVNIGSCAESSRKSSHSPQSSEQHTPRQSPERSPDESSHTFGANLSSPTLGESASTYAPHHPQTSDVESSDSEEEGEEDENERRDAEEEKRANMARPSLLYHDEKKFYDNLLGQVQQLLHTDGTERPTTPDPVPLDCSNEPDLPRALPDISMATLEELEKLGINLHSSDITFTDRSLYRSLYNVSPDLHPHINYVSLADFTFDPSDLSMEANAIAMKYLSDGELAKLSAGFQGDKTPGRRGGGGGGVNPLLRSVLTGIREEGGASGRGGDVDSSIGVNMSLASRKYMEKYGLMSGGDGGAVLSADSASPRGVGNLLKPSPVRFMKSPAIARTNIPREGRTEDKPRMQAKPTRLCYSPAAREITSHQSEGTDARRPGEADLTSDPQTPSDPQAPNVLGHLKAQKCDRDPGVIMAEDSSAKGNILDISKLKQLPKLL